MNALNPQEKAVGKANFHTAIGSDLTRREFLDAHLAGREYMVGDAFSMADIDAFVSCGFSGWIRKSIPADCANLKRWHAAIAQRACVQAA